MSLAPPMLPTPPSNRSISSPSCSLQDRRLRREFRGALCVARSTLRLDEQKARLGTEVNEALTAKTSG
jgi:hypothetical protein